MTEQRAQALVPADHPCIAGHFPGNPIVPGVVLIDCVLDAVRGAVPGRPCAIPNIKFLQPLRPGQAFSIIWTQTPDGLRFRCESVGDDGMLRVHMQGSLSFSPLS